MISTAEAPSLSGEELPGVIFHSIGPKRASHRGSANAGRGVDRAAAVVPGRTVSSAVTTARGPWTPTISFAKPPAATAAAAS